MRNLLVLVVVLFLAIGISAQPNDQRQSAPTYPELFQTIWRTVNENFFDPGFVGVDWSAVRARYAPEADKAKTDVAFAAVIRKMLGELPVSHLTIGIPRQQGNVGVGIRTKLIEGKTVVVHVSPGSDAQQKGVRLGDIVQNADDEYGPLGSIATLRLKGCDTRTRTANVRRESHMQSERPSIRWRSFSVRQGERIGYIRAVRFDDDSAPAIDRAMEELGTATGLIIDARDNSGGNMSFVRLTSYLSSGEHLVAALITRPFLESYPQIPKQIDPTKLPRIDRAYTTERIFEAISANKGAAAFYSED